jgi:type I restriction enzyme M protein
MANSASDARHSEADIRQKLIEHNLIYGVLTLPSNMFYTVTLPATLWFFDKAKRDNRILFIDARNIFTQIDRAHREFSEEQIQNIAIISRLHKGRREEFTVLIDRYFQQGMKKLMETSERVEPIATQLAEVLDGVEGKEAVASLVKQWEQLGGLQSENERYRMRHSEEIAVNKRNAAQRSLRKTFDPFFAELHEGLKHIDRVVRGREKELTEQARAEGKRGSADRRTKALKTALEALHAEVKNAESYFKHIHWLQERFPNAAYEDVTGLCKLATPEEVKEQDYSLNPGRYVGVVIEEDGKTEEEFISEIVNLNEQFNELTQAASKIEIVINQNVSELVGE